MNEVSLKPVIEELENLFSKFNARFFADKLEKPRLLSLHSCHLLSYFFASILAEDLLL